MIRMLQLPGVAALLLVACYTQKLRGQDPALPQNDPDEEAVVEKSAAPGKLSDGDLRSLAEMRKYLMETWASLPDGPEGRASPFLPKFEAVKAGLDKVLASGTHEDGFALIPLIAEVLPARHGEIESKITLMASIMDASGAPLIRTAARHVQEQKGKVSLKNLRRFVILFNRDGFYSGCDWEEERIPFDEVGVMILDPVAVMDHLKTLSPKEVRNFFAGQDLKMAFEPYEEGGYGMPFLKARYAANRKQIRAKWSELAEWVAKHPEEKAE